MRAGVGHVDGAAEAELRLIEQIREGMLGDDRIGLRPAEYAAAMAQRVNGEFAIRGCLQLPVRRVVLDPLLVTAGAVTVMQNRRVAVREMRGLVEFIGHLVTESRQMRPEMRQQLGGKVYRQYVL